MLSPVLEKKGIRRPGDVTFARWADGKGLAIDVAVMSPLAATYQRLNGMLPLRSTVNMMRVLLKLNIFSCAMVFETLGEVNVEGEEVLRMIFRFAAKRLGREFTSYCGRAWARLSCNLQRSVAQSILARIDGHDCRDE